MSRIIKLLRIFLHLTTGLVELVQLKLTYSGHIPSDELKRRRQRWHARLTRILGLRIHTHGTASSEPTLLVSNHVSWMDIPVIGSQSELGFLSKAEVRHWPAIGWLAANSGTLFIERGGNEAAEKAIQALREHLNGGHNIVLFPEGTTTDGCDVRRFHPRLFATAFALGVPVQPVALRYHDEHGEPHHEAPFIGEDEFHTHLWRVLKHPYIDVDVHFLPVIHLHQDLKRKQLADSAHTAIRQALDLPQAA